MNLRTPFLTTAAILLAASAFAAPAQAYRLPTVEPVIRNPCANLISDDALLNAAISTCEAQVNELIATVDALVDYAITQVPPAELPDVCSESENVVPYALECAAWAIDQVDPPGSDDIILLIQQVQARAEAIRLWAEDYALVDVPAWYDESAAIVDGDLAALGNWALDQRAYGEQLQGYANGVVTQAGTDAGREVTYAGATAAQATADASAMSAYVVCRLLSPTPCGNPPLPHMPGTPPVPVVPGAPPLPSDPPVPVLPNQPPVPEDPPLN